MCQLRGLPIFHFMYLTWHKNKFEGINFVNLSSSVDAFFKTLQNFSITGSTESCVFTTLSPQHDVRNWDEDIMVLSKQRSTCRITLTSRTLFRNWFPMPAPWEAPGTKPYKNKIDPRNDPLHSGHEYDADSLGSTILYKKVLRFTNIFESILVFRITPGGLG